MSDKPAHDLSENAAERYAIVRLLVTVDDDAVELPPELLMELLFRALRSLVVINTPDAWAEITFANVTYLSEREPDENEELAKLRAELADKTVQLEGLAHQYSEEHAELSFMRANRGLVFEQLQILLGELEDAWWLKAADAYRELAGLLNERRENG